MRKFDEDAAALGVASDKTGIIDRLAKHNAGKDWRDPTKCGYYACKPSWIHEESKYDTKYDVIYFLNPQEQHRCNFGWFTVEQLDQWLAGTGPVIKEKS
jgi:hypothetical protein